MARIFSPAALVTWNSEKFRGMLLGQRIVKEPVAVCDVEFLDIEVGDRVISNTGSLGQITSKIDESTRANPTSARYDTIEIKWVTGLSSVQFHQNLDKVIYLGRTLA